MSRPMRQHPRRDLHPGRLRAGPTVAGGTVEKAERITQGSNIRWRITVRPDGDGQVAITLPATTDCDAEGAICTGDGRMLSNELVLTVDGPGQ